MSSDRGNIECLCILPARCVLRTISFFFFNATATTEIYTLSLHDALPISQAKIRHAATILGALRHHQIGTAFKEDRKSTRLNSSHEWISYAVFCLKKKNSK